MDRGKRLWKRPRRVAVTAAIAAVLAGVSLVGAVAAGARDGHRADDGIAAAHRVHGAGADDAAILGAATPFARRIAVAAAIDPDVVGEGG